MILQGISSEIPFQIQFRWFEWHWFLSSFQRQEWDSGLVNERLISLCLQCHLILLLLLLLSRFSRVWFCATPEMAAHQAPPSQRFSRQEHWSGLPFLLQCMRVKSESEVSQSCPTLRDPMDCNPPGSSVHRIFQARVLEWGAIAFSGHLILDPP